MHWAEVCEHLAIIEELSEDVNFPGSELAAAVASKCFYYLQEYNDALRLGLASGKYFDISERSEYVECLLSKCIDEYSSLCLEKLKDDSVVIDSKIIATIEQLFQRCYADGCYEQAMGIALDAHQLDKVEEICRIALKKSNGRHNIIAYTFKICLNARNIVSREFRLATINILVKMCDSEFGVSDYSNMCFGYQLLNRPVECASLLIKLLKGTDEESLLAYQIAFDMLESEDQGFVLGVVNNIPELCTANPAPAVVAPAPEGPTESATSATGGDAETRPLLEVNSVAATAQAVEAVSIDHTDVTVNEAQYKSRMKKLKRILVDGLDVDLYLNFLFKHCKSDNMILNSIKRTIENRGSILHNATVVSHAYMNAGTTRDVFLRENLDWLGKASNWSKFTAVGSIGVVHKGQVHQSMQLLQPYLPVAGRSSSPYSESGALFALGLIHACKGGSGDSKVITYIADALRNSGNNEVVQHGACLGIGLTAMATGNEELYETLRQILFTDGAVAGEGAALGIGLMLVGQSDSPLAQNSISHLLNYAHDTAHEKIIRGLGLAIAMMVYGKEESADVLIQQLISDRDSIIRYGGMYALAMAYCGTSDNNAVKKLLHVAVSDVNDDVRRAAVISIGFVMFKSPEIVPKLVSLLAESFNPHVRYGAAMAIGIACAGSASKDATDILFEMLTDQVDFVKQGVYLSLALVLMETSEARTSVVKRFREHLSGIVNDKYQTAIAKSGAILAHGLLDAGGRNCVMSMQSRTGVMKRGAAVGCLLWVQYWYWYPMMLTLSLSLTPTAMIGLNEKFDMPNNYQVKCNAPPSVFAYPSAETKREDDKKLIATAVLSTTVKARAREARKEAKKHGPSSPGKSSSSNMEVQSNSSSVGKHTGPSESGPALERVVSHLSTTSYISLEKEKTKKDEAEENENAAATKKEKEPTSFYLKNPSRVTSAQVKYVATIPPGTVMSNNTSHGDATANSDGDEMKVEGEESSASSSNETSTIASYLPIREKFASAGSSNTAPVGIVMLLNTGHDVKGAEEVTKG